MRTISLLSMSLLISSALPIVAQAANRETPVELERTTLRSEKVEADRLSATPQSPSTTSSKSNSISFSSGGKSFRFDFDGGWDGSDFNFKFFPGLKSVFPQLWFSPWKLVSGGWLICLWLAASLLIAVYFRPHLLRAREEFWRSPGTSVALGVVWQLAFWALLAAFGLLCLVLIGIPLVVALVVFDFVLGIFGMALVFSVVGEWLARRLNLSAPSIYVAILLGGVALGLLRMLPFLGSAVWFVAGLVGVGALLAAQLGIAKTPTSSAPALPA